MIDDFVQRSWYLRTVEHEIEQEKLLCLFTLTKINTINNFITDIPCTIFTQKLNCRDPGISWYNQTDVYSVIPSESIVLCMFKAIFTSAVEWTEPETQII